MHKLTVILASWLLIFSVNVLARDLESEEVELREAPQSMYDKISQSVSLPIDFKNREQFEQQAASQGYDNDELEHKLLLLARLTMEPSVKSAQGSLDATQLIELLASIAESPYEKASVAMLRGRNLGRTAQRYQEAIAFYNEALTRINDSYDIESMLLKHTIHEHLGGLHLVLRQDVPALMHFHTYRDIAYKLRNDYLIAAAEAKLGHYYNKNQQLTKSLQHYSEAIRLSNQSNYPTMKTHLQLQLAKVYRDLKQWDEALKNAHEAAAGFKKLGNDTYLSSCMTVIAMVYSEQGDWNKAIDYYLNAQQLDAKNGNYIAQGLNFHNLGQAYSHINDEENALKYLLMANQVFIDKKSYHYQVYNELLIGEIAQTKQDWTLMINHAEKALSLATDLKLPDEQRSALTQIAFASEQMGDTNKLISTQKQIIALGQQKPEAEVDSAVSASLLAEQQLKLELNVVKGKLSEAQRSTKNTNRLLALCALLATLFLITLLILLKKRSKLTAQNQMLITLSQQDPFTQHPGYTALIADLDDRTPNEPATEALVLVEFPAHLKSDLNHGQYFANAVTKQFTQLLNDCFAMPVYVVRQGLFAIRFTESVQAEMLLSRLTEQMRSQLLTHQFNMGMINLPLLGKSDINMDPKLKFECAQMALAGCRSLSRDHNHYVSLRALDFVPSSLFANPIFLHLEKGIERGLIRFETNGRKEDIIWPRWEHNQDRHLLENI
ncbi:tetratricopeptide repeat protein [Shewanella acanthi]|uniref:tetratricopeptide repeat protein n=1 Tax=Shewanella acanthi TaxID=2864212 RepID=UPI001C65A15C|nr:tetratricopeptide repeat protein [Shewanella acanthi]QYJ77861.1 tetratricopeptide repeat protein [Shewanella acanthi]